jgi:hypothetical protein
MYDVEKICELLHRLDEYERFCEYLFFMLHDKDVHRQSIVFRDKDVPLHDFISKEIKKLIGQCSTSER